jgi:hypothetical protein
MTKSFAARERFIELRLDEYSGRRTGSPVVLMSGVPQPVPGSDWGLRAADHRSELQLAPTEMYSA